MSFLLAFHSELEVFWVVTLSFGDLTENGRFRQKDRV
jgi:hypothetical protein